MAAKEENTVESLYNVTKQVIESCTFGEVDVDKMPFFDVEWLFLQIRIRSIGDIVELKYNYTHEKDGKPYAHPIKVEVDLKDVKIKEHEGHNKRIKLGSGLFMDLKYPTLANMAKYSNSEEDEMLADCIETIFNESETFEPDTREELILWLEGFGKDETLQVTKFFNTIPRLEHTITVKLPTGEDKSITLKGLEDFFG